MKDVLIFIVAVVILFAAPTRVIYDYGPTDTKIAFDYPTPVPPGLTWTLCVEDECRPVEPTLNTPAAGLQPKTAETSEFVVRLKRWEKRALEKRGAPVLLQVCDAAGAQCINTSLPQPSVKKS